MDNQTLDKDFWDNQYQNQTTGWDLGRVSPPLKYYFDTLSNKNIRILIPGCGNSYEAEYLLEQGFTNITIIDISPSLVKQLQLKFNNNTNIKIVLGDFFEHEGVYDLIVEQTFFCALVPTLRPNYVWKMHHLLSTQGKIMGVLFNRTFENSPPFGGNITEYISLFKSFFDILKIENCRNSVSPRAGTELFFEFNKITK